MKIAVLDLCVWLEEYQYDQPGFGALVATWLQRGLPEADFTIVDVHGGDPLPDLTAFDGFALSGSEKGVYDAVPWMAPLRAWLLEAKTLGKPLFGICFGHQIMADVFGGKAEKVGAAEIGVRSFELNGQAAQAHIWHQDQVTEVPPDARVIGSAPYCPVAALAYDFPAMSVQFHPEYSGDYVATFIQRSRGAVLSERVSDDAVAQFGSSPVGPDLFAREAATFFRKALSVPAP